jgi:microcystin-dependent protein
MPIPSFTTGQVLTASQQNTLASYAVPTGSVTAFAGSTAPTNFLLCDGAAVSRTTYSELFTLIGTTFGVGDGSTTFNVPNLKGRVIVGIDASQTEFDVRGETGGAKTVTLTTAEMPNHNHTQDAHTHAMNDFGVAPSAGGYPTANGFVVGGAGTNAAAGGRGNATVTATNQATGGGGAHNNLQPYMALNYIIKI